MIDLETLSTRVTASIVSIGAVEFDPHGNDSDGVQGMRRPFYARVRPITTMPQFHVDAGTIGWWMQQSVEAIIEFNDPDRYDLTTALQMFYQWVHNGKDTAALMVEDIIIWSHEGFDLPILSHAYDIMNASRPYHYRSGRDIRTIIHAAFGRNLDVEEEVEGFPKNPQPHHPVYDAWHQSVMVQECFRRLSK